MTSPPLCGKRMGRLECVLEKGHDGPHQSLYPLANGNFADVWWTDDYTGVAEQPWIASLVPDFDTEEDPLAWVVYGDAPTEAEAVEWTKS